MLNNKKITVVMPAYNAGKTLKDTYLNLDKSIIDEIILCDDKSADDTVKIAKSLDINTIEHTINKGYGANQKSLYNKALENGADIVVMVHPDNQYEPKLAITLASLIAYGVYDCALASRFFQNSAKNSKMPRYKYFANRFLTSFQNLVFNAGLSEYHTGYRAYDKEVLKSINYNSFDDDFIFDNQMLAHILDKKYKIGEISCPCKYFDEASSINLSRSIKYGMGVLAICFKHLFKIKY